MERESFEDTTVAEKLRESFVAIKVDKEERPDIDSIYMSVCQAMTGSGGWPLTIIMTPAREPFFAGTYLPKHTRAHTLGLIELLSLAAEKWKAERGNIEAFSHRVAEALRQEPEPHTTDRSTDSYAAVVTRAAEALRGSFDEAYGGFGGAPKFPMPHNLLFLLKLYTANGDASLLHMTEKTLTQMYRGGIFDHIGYGFSRYSTDAQWLAPHFEKMLYDNALLIMAYTDAYRATENEVYRSVAQKTIQYVLRELMDDGGFTCAQDADSNGVEGKYYLFEPREITALLGASTGAAFNRQFDITAAGNFEGKSIPNLLQTPHIDDSLYEHLPTIYAYRKSRATLHRDDKILTSWNGLMIAALANAYGMFGEPEYLDAAATAVRFVDSRLSYGDTLFASYRDGKRSEHGFLDDYAFYVWGLLSLYSATLEDKYLRRAEALTQKCITEFYDEPGGFFLYGENAEPLLFRPKEIYDGALPSGNAVMAYNLLTLSRILKSETLAEYAENQLRYMVGRLQDAPQNGTFFILVLTDYLYPPREIVCVLKDSAERDEIAKKLDKTAVVTVLEHETDNYRFVNDRTTYYVCEQNHCLPPTNAYPPVIPRRAPS